MLLIKIVLFFVSTSDVFRGRRSS